MKLAFLTDFHFGRVDSVQQNNAARELLKLLKQECAEPIDVVLLAGDWAYSGVPQDYELFGGFLSDLRQIPALSRSQFLGVPGNHDLDCNVVDPLTWSGIGKDRQKLYFEESPAGVGVRRPRAQGFRAFEEFAERNGVFVPRPSAEVTRIWTPPPPTKLIHFVLTNTAFFSNKEKDLPGDGQLPAPTYSLRTALGGLAPEADSIVFVVGHHPISAFIFEQQGPLKTLLVDSNAVYLHGHTHRLAAEYQQHGLRSLGFGAVYQGSADAAPVPYYANSVALCSLESGALTVRLFHWDCANGRWVATTSVPSEFEQSESVPSGRYTLRLPSKRRNKNDKGASTIPLRGGPRCSALSVILGADAARLLEIDAVQNCLDLAVGDLARKLVETPGSLLVQYATSAGAVRVSVMTAGGQLVTKDDVEEANTTIDYEGLDRYCIVTTGAMSPEARTSYLRLRERKPLLILDHDELAEVVYRALPAAARGRLETLDSATARVEILIAPSTLYVCVQEAERAAWFYLLTDSGDVVAESDTVVRALRELRPRLSSAHYGPPDSLQKFAPATPLQQFDRSKYLAAAYQEFNQVKYAALASLGFRFSSITLDELYVAATATDGSPDVAAIARAADDALQALGLPEELRVQLEAQIRRLLRGRRNQESGAARRLYQRHGKLLVLGDPGSGKTCFVKHEILAYCAGERAEPWYSQHLPIYVPLTELGEAISNRPDGSLMEWVSSLCRRRGLDLPAHALIELAAAGKVAFFFDGLDEVTSLDRRAQVFLEITKAVEAASASGNRIIVTSRPAAIRLVEVPKGLRVAGLKGLSEEEMRVLARRVLAARMVEEGVDLPLDDTPLEASDTALVERIVADCVATPGLRRLAQNPLLFTLLIVIYAMSGAPAAKRHRVYQQAVQTLATVRSRTTGHRAFSEADLRRRLGAIALFVFSGTNTLPRWEDAVQVLRRILAQERRVDEGAVELAEADTLLQDVGEATGLVVPRRSGPQVESSFFTFMHHSFLEYYAAVGLLLESDAIEHASALAEIPRWREVILLFSGILADQQDATPLVARLLQSVSSAGKITLDRLELAIESALEAEVPSETAQAEVLAAFGSWGMHSLKRDPTLRSKFGRLLERLYLATRGRQIVTFLETGLAAEEIAVVASYVELTGVVFSDVEAVSATLLSKFEDACARGSSLLLVSVCEALASAPALRTPRTLPCVESALKGSVSARYAAMRACERAPQLARTVWSELREGIRTGAPYLAVTCASAILRAGWRVDPGDPATRAEMTRALQCLLQFGREEHLLGVGTAIDLEIVEAMLVASEPETRLLGVCLLPWVSNASREVYQHLVRFATAGDTDRIVRVTALGGLRLSPDIRYLLKISDLDQLYLLLSAPTRDVRMATARLIGQLRAESGSQAQLMKYAEDVKSDAEEFRAALRALGESDADLSSIHSYLEGHVFSRLAKDVRQTEHWRRETLEFLQLALQSNRSASPKLVSRLRSCIDDTQWPGDVRGAALVCLAWLWEPSETSVDFMIAIAARPPGEMRAARAEAIWRFVLRCGKRVAYVRAVQHKLDALTEAIVKLGTNSSLSENAQSDFSRLREALTEISTMKNAYEEYASRTTPTNR